MAPTFDRRWAIVAVDAAGRTRTVETFDSHREAMARWLALVSQPDPQAERLSLEPLGTLAVDALSPEAWNAAVGEPVHT